MMVRILSPHRPLNTGAPLPASGERQGANLRSFRIGRGGTAFCLSPFTGRGQGEGKTGSSTP
jgi:hypothetical protein